MLKWETVLFIVFALGIYTLIYLQRDSTFFLYGIAQVFLIFCFLVVLVYSLVKNIINRSKQPSLSKWRHFLVGLILVPTFPLLSYMIDMDGGKKTFLEANAGGDLTSVQLDLRDDHTFKLYNGGPLGGTYYRGHYQLQNDTLKLDNGDKNLYPTLTFVLRYDSSLKRKYFDPTGINTAYYKLYILDRKPGR